MAKVGIVMGSDSDMPVMAKAADILEQLGIDYEMTIISAHREPDVFFEYAKTAEAKGFKVIIAGAGMAAHLPGMCAAIFPMPVIGIPMHTTSLGGRDSLYSIVQMPSGIPVATVAINGAKNAAYLALQILGNCHESIRAKLAENGKRFSSANSINVGRLLPQVVYYISAYADLVAKGEISEGETVNVTVPTGNFGNILACYYATKMGLPVNKFICASNKNNVSNEEITHLDDSICELHLNYRARQEGRSYQSIRWFKE